MRHHKIIAIALMAFGYGLSASGQEFQGYGKIAREEINMTSCSFDPDAEAIILVKEAYSDYDDHYQLITNYHVRMKIFKKDASDLANISIPYYSSGNFESIVDVEGMTINYDENGLRSEQPLDRKSVFTRAMNPKWSEKTFAFPAVRAGSIIEYKYKSIMQHYGGLDDWKFQDYLPVVRSTYNLVIAPNLKFAYQVYKRADLSCTITPDQKAGSILFEMKNIPGLRNEPYMNARRDYLQRVIFQLSGTAQRSKINTSWKELNRDLGTTPEFGNQLNKNLGGTEDFVKLAKTIASPFDRMKAVVNYVRSNMSWNNFVGVYSVDGIKSAWSKKSGSTADINLILVNLLREVGLEADPMLVSERDHGKVNTNYPFIDQFNSVFACVYIGDKKYIINGTDRLTPPNMTPNTILNTTAFVVNRSGGSLITVEDTVTRYKEWLSIAATVGNDGSLHGEVLLNSEGYARNERLALIKSDREKYVASNFREKSGITIDDLNITGMENDSLPLRQQFKFSLPGNTSGDYFIIPANLFSRFESNPFISNQRFSDIDFGYRQEIAMNTTLEVPELFAIDALPKSIKLVNQSNTIVMTRQVLYDAPTHKLVARIKIEMLQTYFPADHYVELKEFFKKMTEYLQEPIILKKR